MNYACNEPNTIETFNKDIDKVIEHYSKFLNDGDFEKYMPMIDKPDPKELTRIAWIMNRFTEYGSADWNLIHAFFTINFAKIRS